jgi:hypothetical protein
MTDVDDWRDPRDDWEPSEPDFEAEAYAEHCEEAHGGKPCNCPLPTQAELDAAWEERAKAHREEEHDGGPCDCIAPF